jgi:uncharacterized protein involved in response to NO
VLRIVAAFSGSMLLIHAAAFAWIAAFVGFLLIYGPLLTRHKPAWAEARC